MAMSALARRARIRSFHRVLARSYCNIDQSIEDFNQELENIFGTPAGSSPRILPKENEIPSARASASEELPRTSLPSLSPSRHLTHVDSSGKASMVDVSHKTESKRNAVASGKVILGPDVFHLVAENKIAKGDVLTVAKIAGIQAAKQTAMLIPLCHAVALSSIDVKMALNEEDSCVAVTAEASSVGRTGVEMEALTAVSIACLTVYDMCKAASKAIQISGIELLSKSGGKSGDWHRKNS